MIARLHRRRVLAGERLQLPAERLRIKRNIRRTALAGRADSISTAITSAVGHAAMRAVTPWPSICSAPS